LALVPLPNHRFAGAIAVALAGFNQLFQLAVSKVVEDRYLLEQFQLLAIGDFFAVLFEENSVLCLNIETENKA
jgi:hypothetical protein